MFFKGFGDQFIPFLVKDPRDENYARETQLYYHFTKGFFRTLVKKTFIV